MLSLVLRFIRYNLSGHASNLPNLIAASVGMFVNNLLFLIGMWGILFAGRTENQPFLHYYIALNALIMTAWGTINFFFGGWLEMGEIIVNGHFESKLATPRHPLLLVGAHVLHPSALGDLVMGLMGIGILFFMGLQAVAVRALIATSIATGGLFATFILAGSLAFYIPRGNAVALLLNNITVMLSTYPVGKIFTGDWGRLILLLSPAGVVSLMPMDWIEQGTVGDFLKAGAGVIVAIGVALFVYRQGVKRFQSVSLVGIQL